MREENEIRAKLAAFVRTLPDAPLRWSEQSKAVQLEQGLKNLQARLAATAPSAPKVEGLDE